jgi:hypothetical protein
MKQLWIAEDLVNVLGPECKDDALVTIAEFREFTLRLVQTEHASGGICGEIGEPILLRGRKGLVHISAFASGYCSIFPR